MTNVNNAQDEPIQSSEVYRNPNGFDDLFKRLNEQRVNSIECDFQLTNGHCQRPVHRCIARALSPVIDQALRSDAIDSNNTTYEIVGLSTEALDKLINYAYTAEISLNPRTAIELYTASVRLQISFLPQVIMVYLRECMNVDMCLEALTQSGSIESTDLRKEAIQFCTTNYEDVVKHPDFVRISSADLSEVVEHPKLIVRNERNLFDSIKRWLAHNPHARDQYGARLSESIRFQLFEVQHILDELQDQENVVFHPQMRKALLELGTLVAPIAKQKWERKPVDTIDVSTAISDIQVPGDPLSPSISAVEALEIQEFEQELSDVCSSKETSAVSASPNQTTFLLTVFGGRSTDKKLHRDIVCYRINQKESNDMDQSELGISLSKLNYRRILPNVRKGFGAASSLHQAFLIGGQPASAMRTVDVYDIHQDEWLMGPSLLTGRAWHSVTRDDNVIFALGGVGAGGIMLPDGEMLDLRTGYWSLLPQLRRPRMSLASTVHEDTLYAIGGLNETTIEALDLRAWKWRTVLTLDQPRESPGISQYDGNIYVFGGSTSAGPLNSTHRFVPTTGTWEPVQCMPLGRAFFATVTHENYVFVLGGRDAKQSCAHIQLYDMRLDQWVTLPESLPSGRSSSCALILSH